MKSYIKSFMFLSLFLSTQAFADVTFYCSQHNSYVNNAYNKENIQEKIHFYFKELGLKEDWVNEHEEQINNLDSHTDKNMTIITYSLKEKSNNLLLKDNPIYNIHNENITLPISDGRNNRAQYKSLSIVSKKEILLALLQPGRDLKIVNDDCSIDKLKDHVAIRQNIVAWTSDLEWQWPDGDAAQWNKKYWNRGTPYHKHSLVMAFNDLFFQQNLYGIGCYTASKIVMIQGILDYYSRIKKDPVMVKHIEAILWKGGEPLEDIEPPVMWQFEEGYEHSNDHLPGKLLSITKTTPENFVPGDWSYMLNTDSTTYQKTGYEGSNAIYLGQNLFDDYYNDNHHSYTYHEKLNEVYQWRHHVFSHRRDKDKIEFLTPEQLDKLGKTPEKNGLLLEEKIAPIIF